MTISKQKLKEAERIVRLVMIVILLTAGTSKFFSQGGFYQYYLAQFQGDLRISLSPVLVGAYLRIIPFVEILLGLALIFARTRVIAIYGWFLFMLSLLVGHYVLQEFSVVNQMIDYFFLGLACLILPAHTSLFARPDWSSAD
ncbi:MAG: hypothetical protein R3192_12230 [Woeseiaceae bacterium]|nr:hypothetical protein [Woeseiaceae bacterium]